MQSTYTQKYRSIKIRIAIADPYALTMHILAVVLKTVENFAVVGESNSMSDLLQVNKLTTPDIIFMEESLLNLNGLQELESIKKINEKAKIIIATANVKKLPIKNLLALGVRGFLPKKTNFSSLQNAINEVYNHEYYIHKNVTDCPVENDLLNNVDIIKPIKIKLTAIEKRILIDICKDKSLKEIAAENHLSKRTLERYKYRLQQKTGAKTVVGLVLFTLKNKYL